MFKFVETDVEAISGKRKPPLRACDACRRRKKKCKHVQNQGNQLRRDSSSPGDDAAQDADRALPAQTTCNTLFQTNQLDAAATPQRMVANRDIDGSPCSDDFLQPGGPGNRGIGADHRNSEGTDSRFIGDMNPEGIFLSATSPDHLRSGTDENNVGIWLAKRLDESSRRAESVRMAPQSSLFYGYASPIQKMILNILEQDCLTTLPPSCHKVVLLDVYFKNFHPLFPVIEKSALDLLPVSSSSRILLEQAICLVASMNFESEDHLKISDDNTQLTPGDFGRRLLAAMRILIETGIVTEKIVLLQALALMSFFTDCQESSETSSLLVGRAVQYVFSLGLHIEKRNVNQENDHKKTLFCCIWGLDRLNAAFQGRPTLMHERDVHRSLRRCFDAQTPLFRLVLNVTELLDKVIQLYRPNSNEPGIINNFSLFEDLVLQAQATQSPSYMLATIEVFYHAVAILSCRVSEPESELDRSATAASRVRQAFSAEKVTIMVGREYKDRLVLFPFIPYAVTLSLSVNYRQMRRSTIPMSRARARIGFEANSRILKHLGAIFWSASTIADMADVTLRELDRVYAGVAESDSHKNQQEVLDASMNEASMRTVHTVTEPLEGGGHQGSTDQSLHTFDFTEMPDFDPFAMFNPDFDLDAIDACLEGNLSLGVPAGIF